MGRYRIIFITDEKQLPILLGAVNPSEGVELESVNAMPEGVRPPPLKGNGAGRYANGKRKKDMAGDSIVLQELIGKKYVTAETLKKAFVAHGYKPSSATTYLGRLTGAGKIERLPNQRYRLMGQEAI